MVYTPTSVEHGEDEHTRGLTPAQLRAGGDGEDVVRLSLQQIVHKHLVHVGAQLAGGLRRRAVLLAERHLV